MATTSALMLIKGFFNDGDGMSIASDGGDNCPATVAGIPAKRDLKTFRDEYAALTPEDKTELAEAIAALA